MLVILLQITQIDTLDTYEVTNKFISHFWRLVVDIINIAMVGIDQCES